MDGALQSNSEETFPKMRVGAPLGAGVIGALLVINILWGGTTVAAKIAMNYVPPYTLAFLRFSLAAVLMYGIALLRRTDMRVNRSDWGRFWALGVLGLALTYILTYLGILRTNAANASLLIATEPIYLTLLSAFLLHEALTRRRIAGIALGIVGVYLIIGNGFVPRHTSEATVGDLLIAGGLAFEALSSIVGKDLVSKYPTMTVMSYQLTLGALALAPFALSDLWHFHHSHATLHFHLSALLALFYLIVPCTVFAYTVWFALLDKHEAGDLSMFLFLQPVVGALLGVAIEGDALTPYTWGGAIFVLTALVLIPQYKRNNPAPILWN